MWTTTSPSAHSRSPPSSSGMAKNSSSEILRGAATATGAPSPGSFVTHPGSTGVEIGRRRHTLAAQRLVPLAMIVAAACCGAPSVAEQGRRGGTLGAQQSRAGRGRRRRRSWSAPDLPAAGNARAGLRHHAGHEGLPSPTATGDRRPLAQRVQTNTLNGWAPPESNQRRSASRAAATAVPMTVGEESRSGSAPVRSAIAATGGAASRTRPELLARPIAGRGPLPAPAKAGEQRHPAAPAVRARPPASPSTASLTASPSWPGATTERDSPRPSSPR